jgi:NAD+ kinase
MAKVSTSGRSIVLVAYQSRPDALELATTVSSALAAEVDAVQTHLIGERTPPPVVESGTLVVSLGGDGTFLRAARIAHSAGASVLGVNLGRVGFLLRVSASSVLDEIRRALRGDLGAEHRVALRVTSPDHPVDAFCLNEVVLEREQPGRMVRVRAFIDGDEFLTYSADGVLVSTATGSTGYNFSAGGPVVSTELDVLVLTPIAPHFTIDRSIVVGAHQPIRLQVIDRSAVIVADGEPVGTLESGSCIDVQYDPIGVTVLGTDVLGLGTRIRQSLREGHA